MKRIEDAPKELQDMFDLVWEQCVRSASGISDYRDEIEHAFLKGFDVAMATGGLPQRPKRTIQTIVKSHNSNLYALSTDGKVFYVNTGGVITDNMKWIQLPDLPKEDGE